MPEVFITKATLYLHREVVIHFHICKCELILINFVSKVQSYDTPDEWGKFPHVPWSSCREVGVEYCQSKNNTCSSPHPSHGLVELYRLLIGLELRVEIKSLAFAFSDVATHHLLHQILILSIMNYLSTSKDFPEDILVETWW